MSGIYFASVSRSLSIEFSHSSTILKPKTGHRLLGLDCGLNKVSGLNGHPVNELLYNIIQQSTLPNDIFFKNEEYVACLFKDRSFAFDMGNSGKLTFGLDWVTGGAVYLFIKENRSRGLSLGEIRSLTRELIRSAASAIALAETNWFSHGESQPG
ncbi:hypothetical protein DL771_000020 [Monosporascus sp. 5C6A]|nr:hypothetical protein DL771_000020 [Monosporascus sp. 5C6A]